MTRLALLARDRYWLQIAFVAIAAVAAVAFVLVTDALAFRSPVNLSWMVGLPVVIATVANTDWGRRCVMMLALVPLSLVVSTIVGVNFTSYG
jgi:hypothetical protein